MSAGTWFWILYVLFVVLGTFFWWPGDRAGGYRFAGGVVVFILLGLLGWGTFGPPIR